MSTGAAARWAAVVSMSVASRAGVGRSQTKPSIAESEWEPRRRRRSDKCVVAECGTGDGPYVGDADGKDGRRDACGGRVRGQVIPFYRCLGQNLCDTGSKLRSAVAREMGFA